MKYVPLHLHTEYSLLDGAIRIKDLCKYAKENDMPAVAITDHGVMYGAIEMYLECKEAGVKPLIGVEFYVHNGDITEKDPRNNPLYHLVLIAKDLDGYKNLIKLVSTAHCKGLYYKPRINFDLIQKYSKGLVCLSACLGGEVLQDLLHNNYEEAKRTAAKYKELFGDDYYIELQDHGLPEQKRTNPDLIKIANELDIKMVITNDSHYLKKEDAEFHDTLLCVQTQSLKADENRMHFENNEFYVKDVTQLRDAFSWMDSEMFEQCIHNTVDIAEKCNLIMTFGDSPLPHYEVPKGHTVESYLSYLVYEGLKERYGEDIPKEIDERAKYELGVIEKMGFSAYFLITWDFVNFAKEHKIPVGPGRGSAAGSLVAYSLGITDLDPIKHNLLFERFLNLERYTMPDVDIDFCVDRRSEVIDYVTQKYGADRVCQIITFGTFAARAALKAVARVYDIEFAKSNLWASYIPDEPKAKIDDALHDGMELKKLYDEDEEVRKIVDMAKAIEGLKYNVGTHAAGVIISHVPLDEIVPVQPSKKGIIEAAYPMANLEKIGLLKMDFLALRNLTIIDNTLKMIKKRKGIDVVINKIPLDDKPTYDMLVKGDTMGVFQLESAGMTNLVKKLKPDVFEDLGALVALFRPGPLDSGMVDDFVDRKHGKQEIKYPHPLLEPVLKDTYGTLVYQEQIMQIFQVLADYSLGQADKVRRMMGKKKIEEMMAQKEIFIQNSAQHGMKKEDATALFDQIVSFASYCFNRSHSAAYAFVAYQTAYLKCHYPVEYFTAILSSVQNDKDQTQAYIEHAQKRGMKVLIPDINHSYTKYFPDGDNIRFGLGAIKQVGTGVCDAIIEEREKNGEYKNIFDFCKRVDAKVINKKSMEGLIKAGAFTSLGHTRKILLENLDYILGVASRESKSKETGQVSLFEGGADSGFEDVMYSLEGDNTEYDERQIQNYEKEFLGFYISSHPLFSIRDKLPFLSTHKIADLEKLEPDKVVMVCGLVTNVRQIPYKNDPAKFMKVITIEDLSAKAEIVCYYDKIAAVNDILVPEQKLIVSTKIKRKFDGSISYVMESAKTVDNSNLLTIKFLTDGLKFEEMHQIKDILVSHKGYDPVMFLSSDDNKIIASSSLWVNASNDLVNQLSKLFPERVEAKIKSMDSKD